MYNAMSNLSLTHSFFSSPSLFFRSLSSRIAILELNSARCVTTQLLCHLQGLIEDTRRRCRLSHRASSISILTGFVSFLSSSYRGTFKKAGHRFWPMSLLVSFAFLTLFLFLHPPPLLSLSLSLSLSFSWSQMHTVLHITDKVKVVSLRSLASFSASTSANLLQVSLLPSFLYLF